MIRGRHFFGLEDLPLERHNKWFPYGVRSG